MAVVRTLKSLKLEKESPHSEVECTYSIVTDDHGQRYLQVDTYGSTTRQIPGKKSQSIRFAPEAIEQLKVLLANHF
ncbi:MAG: methionyl-tRNA formyltransferase [Acidobacteria bacterium]|nr:methionyl-tRNA formyltransferase [Acidobacteriota bacterium]